MYEFIAGTLVSRTATSVIVDANGVGYELLAPLGASFASGPGDQVRVFSHLAVREDAQTLYGFPARDARDLFRILLKVRGVGPAMALGVMSGLNAEELARAVADEDLNALTRVKGVGKKTAEQILLDLRDKQNILSAVAGSGPRSGSVPAQTNQGAATPAGNEGDAVSALVSIGYSEKEAGKKVASAVEAVGSDDLEELVRAAMRG